MVEHFMPCYAMSAQISSGYEKLSQFSSG